MLFVSVETTHFRSTNVGSTGRALRLRVKAVQIEGASLASGTR
jgi:hypothetical protein